MNKNNAAEFIPLMQAFVEGKTIQVFNTTREEWQDTANPEFCSPPKSYRIKPEPRQFEGVTQATSRWSVDDNGHIRLAVNWPSSPPKIGTKFRLTEII